jgi:hypothetical protein
MALHKKESRGTKRDKEVFTSIGQGVKQILLEREIGFLSKSIIRYGS